MFACRDQRVDVAAQGEPVGRDKFHQVVEVGFDRTGRPGLLAGGFFHRGLQRRHLHPQIPGRSECFRGGRPFDRNVEVAKYIVQSFGVPRFCREQHES